MAKIYGELVRAQFQLLAAAPTPAVRGLVYYHTGSGVTGVKVYDGTNWVSAGGGGWYVSPAIVLSADGVITLASANNIISVSGSGAVTLSATPFGTAAPTLDGTVVRLIGSSSDNTVTILHSDISKGAWLNGDITLGRGSMIELQWVGALDRWVEVSRNMIGGI